MIIWGLRTFRKIYGRIGRYQCANCHNQAPWYLLRAAKWFTLFFIPIVPLKFEYYFFCSVCDRGQQLRKSEFLQLREQIKAHPQGQ